MPFFMRYNMVYLLVLYIFNLDSCVILCVFHALFISQRPRNEAFRTPSTPGRQAKLIINPSADMGNNHFLFSGFFSDFLKPK